MFRRQVVLPVDVSKPHDEQPEMKDFDGNQIDLVMEERRERLEIVKENIVNAQRKQKSTMTETLKTGSFLDRSSCLEKKKATSLKRNVLEVNWTTSGYRSLQDHPFNW